MKYALLAPAVVLFAIFVAWPIVEVVRLSLTETNFITTEYVGIANYVDALTSSAFLRSAVNSAAYVLLLPLFTVGSALAVVSWVMASRKRWHDATRILFYVPALSAGIIIAQVWRWVFHIDGPLNWILGTRVAWWSRSLTGIPAIVLIVAATSVGGSIIVILASVLSIDRSLFDAAKIDGASRLQIKVRIVAPIIAPAIGAMLLLSAIAAPQIFETVYALAPYEHTATLTFAIYRDAFVFGRHGRAAAEAILLLVAMGGLTYAQQKIKR